MNIKEINWEAQLDTSLVSKSVIEALNTKKIFRYQYKSTKSAVNKLEELICDYVGSKFSLATSSATNAIFLALKSLGIDENSKVLIPSFTFTAVPSAVVQCGAEPVLVDITENYVIDLKDLEVKISTSQAKYLLLSHMRGHLCDMDKVVEICKKNDVVLIEDAAHALGVKWKGRFAGTFGLLGIFSLQSYKVINAGEGGILITNDPYIFWKTVVMSGSYEDNYLSHSIHNQEIASSYKNQLPVFNVRMNVLTAAAAIPQLQKIEETIENLNEKYFRFVETMSHIDVIEFPNLNSKLRVVRDSVQFRIKVDEESRLKFKLKLNEAGIPISYFGGENNNNARLYKNWKFLCKNDFSLEKTDKNLSEVFDIRLPIHFTNECIDCISAEVSRILLPFIK